MPRRVTTGLSALLGLLALVLVPLSTVVPAWGSETGPTVIGSVIDTGGSPVEGAAVTVESQDGAFSQEATTDAQGSFIVPVPQPGGYTASIDPESVPAGVNVPDRVVEGVPVNVQGDSGSVSIELRRAESLRGTLTNDNEPLTGVHITVEAVNGDFTGEATTDDSGAWEVFVPEPGRYEVILDEGSLPEDVEVREGTSTELTVDVFSSQQRAVLFSFGESGRQVVGFWGQALQLTVEGLRFGLLLALASIGLSLIFGTTGLVNFAHGELIALGAIVAWGLNVNGVPFILAAALTFGLAALAGGAQEMGLWRPLRRRRTGLIAMMIVTIGLSIFLRFTFLFFIGAQPRSYADYVTQAGMQFGPVSMTPRDLWSMAIALVVLISVALALIFTRLGKAMRAVSDNPSLAAASGIDVERVILMVWVAGGALAGLGGVLLGLSQQVKFDMGFDLLLLVFAGVILGGLGTAFGALAGSLVVGLFVTVSTLWIPSELKNVAALAVLILILLFRPQGILGRSERVG